MKIILHCDEYSPKHVPCAIRMQVFTDIFQKKGNEVAVLAAKTCLGDKKSGSKEAIYCPAIELKKKTSFYRMASQMSYAVTSLIKSHAIKTTDVVITTSPPVLISMFGWLIAKFKRAKLVYDVRDIWPDVALEMGSFKEGSLYCKLFRFIANFMFKHADVITTVSPGKVEKIRKKLPDNDKGKVWLVENGLDEKFLLQKEDKSVIEKYHLKDKFTCVYVGNIGLAQGLGHLLDLAETVDSEKYQFLLFGKGAEKQLLENERLKRGLHNVKFCGTVNENTVFSILRNADMTYIPLVNANLKDSIPTKTYEALGAGCPILMVAEGDAPKIVEESRFGRIISPSNIENLSTAFGEFISSYDEIISNREFAKDYVLKEHSRQKITEEFERKLQSIIKK